MPSWRLSCSSMRLLFLHCFTLLSIWLPSTQALPQRFTYDDGHPIARRGKKTEEISIKLKNLKADDPDVQLGLLFFALILVIIGLAVSILVTLCICKRRTRQRDKLQDQLKELKSQSPLQQHTVERAPSKSHTLRPPAREVSPTLSQDFSKSDSKSIESEEQIIPRGWLTDALTESPRQSEIDMTEAHIAR